MDDGDVGGGERRAGVVGLEARVVPALELAEEDVCDHVRREVKGLRDALQVVSDDDRAEHRRDVE